MKHNTIWIFNNCYNSFFKLYKWLGKNTVQAVKSSSRLKIKSIYSGILHCFSKSLSHLKYYYVHEYHNNNLCTKLFYLPKPQYIDVVLITDSLCCQLKLHYIQLYLTVIDLLAVTDHFLFGQHIRNMNLLRKYLQLHLYIFILIPNIWGSLETISFYTSFYSRLNARELYFPPILASISH